MVNDPRDDKLRAPSSDKPDLPYKTPEQITDEDYKVAPTSADEKVTMASRPSRSFPDWQNMYSNETEVLRLPWYTEALDPDLKRELDERKISRGTFLDLGTGPATQAIQLSNLGFDVTGTDISASAIERAERLTKSVIFLVDDIANSKLKDNQFNYIFDRGCFHVLAPADRSKYANKVALLLRRGGILFLKTFSINEPSNYGPYHFSTEMIKEVFAKFFEIQSATETLFQGTLPVLPKALFTVLRKKDKF